MHRVLITGAAGDIGGRMRDLLRGVYPVLRLSDIKDVGPARDGEEVDRTDVRDFAAVEKMMQGVDGVLHLGSIPIEDSWENILPHNIVGVYNVFEAARRQGVKRVVFASSNHAIGFYPRNRRIDHDNHVRPDSRYGLSKAFGEAIGSLYADKYGLRVMCIRIGNASDEPANKRRLSIWIKYEDLAQLVRIGLEHPELHYEIVYGASDNELSWWDNAAAYRLGYKPEGVAEEHRQAAMAREAEAPEGDLADMFMGGPFCADEFAGDLARVLKP